LGYLFNSVKYFLLTTVLGRKKIVAYAPRFQLKFVVAARDVVGRTIFKRGNYEEGITTFLTETFRFEADQVFLDVGANIGWYSLILSRHPQGPARILSFEPDTFNLGLLKENVRMNEANRVEAVPLALSNEPGTKNFYRYSSRNFGRHSLLPINDGDVTEVISTTLDQFWAEAARPGERIGLIKIDTEGYELQVVQGGAQVLQQCPAVLAEFSPGFMRKGGTEPRAFLDFMFGLDFVSFYIEDQGSLKPAPRDELYRMDDESVNLFWRKDVA
jgi:FkbM family methyltransferase